MIEQLVNLINQEEQWQDVIMERNKQTKNAYQSMKLMGSEMPPAYSRGGETDRRDDEITLQMGPAHPRLLLIKVADTVQDLFMMHQA